MKLSEIVNAANSLQKLVMLDLPIKLAWEASKLIDACNPHLEFYGRELQKASGSEQMNLRRGELMELEVGEIALQRIKIPLCLDINLSAADIKCLSPFVEFLE